MVATLTIGATRPAPFPTRPPHPGRADIHFHLLPGVDDGPATIEDSVELAALASAEGTATIVATPHVRGDFLTDVSDLGDRLAEVAARLAQEEIDIELRAGGELGPDMVGRLAQGELDLIAQGPPGARWLLVETPFGGIDGAFTAAADELRDRGFRCVLAHPERALGIGDDGFAAVRRELRAGSALQLNGTSLTGAHGAAARHAALDLAQRFDVVIASDAHGGDRVPVLCAALRAAIQAGVAPPVAHRMVDAGPRGLLHRGVPAPLPAAA